MWPPGPLRNVILDRQVLDPTVVPDQELIVHRGRELEDCRAALDLLADAPTNSCLVIHGPPGTGKTMIAREVLRRLRQQNTLRTAYVDCWEHYTANHALYEVADALNAGGIIHRNSTPTQELTAALQAHPEQRRVAVLDEAEMIIDASVFRTLRDAPKLDIVCIVNDTGELIEEHPDDVRAALDLATSLHFGQYSVQQLIAILSARAEHGIRDGVVRKRAIERFAEAAGGDARLGIAALRAAAESAVEASRDVIYPQHVEPAVTNAARRLHRQTLDRLSEHQEQLYQLIVDADEIEPGELYARYADSVADPKSERTVRTYLTKMAHYGLVTVEGASRDRRYTLDRGGYVDPGVV